MTSLGIVIPLFNKRDFIGETIASLAMQDAPPDQLILVDDASTDGSVEAAERALARHPDAFHATRVAWIRRPSNGGPGAARNAGIASATTDLVLCLDADDGLRADALDMIRGSMAGHGLAVAVIGFASDPPGEVFPDLGILADEVTPLDRDLFLIPSPLRTAAHPDFFMGRASNVVVQRRWLGAQRYCTEARLNEGIDLWYRVLRDIAAAGAPVGLIAAPLIRFRISSESLSHRRFDHWQDLDVPPTVRRYRGSTDRHDRAIATMLAERWLAHALAVLPGEQKALFLAHHHPLLSQLEIPLPSPGSAPL